MLNARKIESRAIQLVSRFIYPLSSHNIHQTSVRKSRMKNKKVLLFLAQGFEEHEAGVFTDVIGWSRILGIEPVDMISTAQKPEIQCKFQNQHSAQ